MKDSFASKLLHRIIYPASVIYTVLSFLLVVLLNRFSDGSSTSADAVEILDVKFISFVFIAIAVYSLLIAFASCIFYTQIITPIKFIIHFSALFIPFLIAVRSVFSTTYQILLIVFIVVYILAAVIVFALRSKKTRKQRDSKEYKTMFKTK